MKLDYVYHSGFAIEAPGVTLILDYYKDSSETVHNQGIVHDELLQRPGKLYVLCTHFHPDHFNPEVLQWKEQRPDIHYIFSKDILRHRRANKESAYYISKGESYEDDTLRIDAFGSTDVGSSFLIHLQ
ncbi:MAG: MBL fold metallo-hydrolase, partial [Bacteroides sp.]